MNVHDLPRRYHDEIARQLYSRAASAGSSLPDPKPKRNKAAALGEAVSGKETSMGRVTVKFTGYRVRPLDPDNFAASIKDLLDGLRHAKLVHGDEYWRIRLETDQERVKTFKEERTEIVIILIPLP